MATFSSPVTLGLDLGLALLAAHFVGDFLFQSKAMVQEKRRPGVLLLHGAIVAAVSYLFAARWMVWEIAAAVFVTHVGIDFLKTRLGKTGATIFALDQLAHGAVIFALAELAPRWGGVSQWTEWWGPRWWSGEVALSGFVMTVRMGGLLVGFWVQPYLDEIQRASTEITDLPFVRPRGLTNGGRLIGQWERALIFLFVGLGQPSSIGFLIAAKSIFRFGELKDRENRMEAEYITIGTLMSFGWAMAISYGTWWAARALL